MTITVNCNLSNAMASEWIVLVLGLIFIRQLFCYILVDGDVSFIQQEYPCKAAA